MPPQTDLLGLADSMLDVAMPEPVERAVLALLDATTVMPLTIVAATEVGASVSGEEQALRALGYLESLRLCTRHRSADGDILVYNPNVWSTDAVDSAAALRSEDGTVRAALTALLEEVASSAGLPQDGVQSVDRSWIDYAVARGLLQRSLVVTTDGREKAFLFSPHMGRSAFSQPTGADPSGHVRQLIGSMVYARNYADWKLRSPSAFLRRLIRDGEAGDASSIATDYPMLETAGIMRVEPGARYHKLVLLQVDIAEDAVTYLDTVSGAEGSFSGLKDQRRWEHPEQQRARMALTADSSRSRPSAFLRLYARK